MCAAEPQAVQTFAHNGFTTTLPLPSAEDAARARSNVVAYRHQPGQAELVLVRIVWAMPCERIVHREDGGRDAYACGVAELAVDELPAQLGFTLALQVGATAEEFG